MPHVLWAEDSPADRLFIQAVLAQLPARPTTEFVQDGEELLERLESARPDLIVLDLAMPKVGGLEALSQLRQRGCEAPVVVFSGAEGAETVAACRRMGAAAFIQKPHDFRDFRGLVE